MAEPQAEASPESQTYAAESQTYAALRLLLNASHTSEPEALPSLLSQAYALVGVPLVRLFLIDYDQEVHAEIAPGPGEPRDLAVDRTPGGTAFSELLTTLEHEGDMTHAWIPLVDGTDRLGVLQIGTHGSRPSQVLLEQCS